jgi:hypothetical protein
LATSGAIVRVSPELLAVGGGERDRLVVERVEVELAVGVREPAVDDVAAGSALGEGFGLRLELPAHRRARLRKIERVDDVRIGRDDVHRSRDDDRSRFVAAQHARGEREGEPEPSDIRSRDVGQGRITGARVIASRHRPVAVLRVRARGARRRRHQCSQQKPLRSTESERLGKGHDLQCVAEVGKGGAGGCKPRTTGLTG